MQIEEASDEVFFFRTEIEFGRKLDLIVEIPKEIF
jgi:hypothetical protein